MAFDLPETSKTIMVKGMSDPWRRFKCELRQDHYDIWNTHQERIDNIPPNVKSEDWIQLCENENDVAVQSKSVVNKRKIEQYDYSHTFGRKPHCLVRAELMAASPEAEISTSDVWIKAHSQEHEVILPSAQPYYEQLTKVLEDIKGKLEADTPVEETCEVTSLFGKDSRGRVRVVGPVSRTQVDLYASARAKIAELKSKDGVLSNKVEDLCGKIRVLIEGFGTLCHVVKDIQDAMSSSDAASNMCSTSHGQNSSQGHVGSNQSGSVAHISSPGLPVSPAAQTSSPDHAISPSQSGAGMQQQCSLLNMEGDIITTCKVCTGVQGLMAHGFAVPATHLKVLIDDILLPDERTIKANQFVETFRDVGNGRFMVHPKRSITYN
ncbi:uncharacterized protein LOC113356382 isoform X2 [Papaver somniferum]|uniref:uncharacterized protein LOC113356382 isoform X2 n=1 Tax=Papaver somniferum TaxID=3469 RepID=UPI000E6FA3E7|nr:uncharacterized protein LOC113356382 isoform X2 [Papaver somniferum]XP_026455282.1 uncharacterized protein LOC113356382 isoform X2 [Papaver somniferum]